MKRLGITNCDIDFSAYELPADPHKNFLVDGYSKPPAKKKSAARPDESRQSGMSRSCETRHGASTRQAARSPGPQLQKPQPAQTVRSPAPAPRSDARGAQEPQREKTQQSQALSKAGTAESKNAAILERITDYMRHISELCEEISLHPSDKQVLKNSVGNIKTYFGNMKGAFSPCPRLLESKLTTQQSRLESQSSQPHNLSNSNIRSRRLMTSSQGKRLETDTNINSFQKSL